MKILLASLMCLVLCTSECFALKGGPPYNGTGASVVGQYAGVLQPPFCPLADPSQCPAGYNSIGIFSLRVPDTGLGSGVALIFQNGRSFTGTITATGNPNSSVITGVLDTQFSYQVQCGLDNTTITATASGALTANITPPKNGIVSVFAILLKGTANVVVTDAVDCVYVAQPAVAFQVDGFKQSNTAQ